MKPEYLSVKKIPFIDLSKMNFSIEAVTKREKEKYSPKTEEPHTFNLKRTVGDAILAMSVGLTMAMFAYQSTQIRPITKTIDESINSMQRTQYSKPSEYNITPQSYFPVNTVQRAGSPAGTLDSILELSPRLPTTNSISQESQIFYLPKGN